MYILVMTRKLKYWNMRDNQINLIRQIDPLFQTKYISSASLQYILTLLSNKI